MTYEEKLSQSPTDAFYTLKRPETIPLIAVMEFAPLSPLICYDKWKLFAPPFITNSLENDLKKEEDDTPDFIINFPFRKSENGTHLNSVLFVFSFKGIVIDVLNNQLPPVGTLERLQFFRQEKWWVWGRPVGEGGYQSSYGWASSFREAMSDLKIQIYG